VLFDAAVVGLCGGQLQGGEGDGDHLRGHGRLRSAIAVATMKLRGDYGGMFGALLGRDFGIR